MRTLITILILLCVSIYGNAQNDVVRFRTMFQNASSESDFERILETEYQDESQKDVVIISSYKAVAHATMAKYAFNPYSKMKYFSEGRDELEALIAQEKCIDNVFLRLILQLNTPEFLNYHDDILQDLEYFVAHVHKSELTSEHKSFMIETILEGKKDDLEFRALFDTLERMNDQKK